MYRLTVLSFAFLSCNVTATLAQDKTYELPSGWYRAGSKPDSYDMGVDNEGGKNHSKAATIKSREPEINGFGTIMQSIPAEKYRGKKLRMRGYMRANNVAGKAGFWMRVDCKDQKQCDFDNMSNRPVTGTQKWERYDVVLDIDPEAERIAYGALLNGTGQIWFDKLDFEVVSNKVESTDLRKASPQNLSFEK